VHSVLSRDLNKVGIAAEFDPLVHFERRSGLELKLLTLVFCDDLLDSVCHCVVLAPQVSDLHFSSCG